MSPSIELFIFGITASFGPCLSFCQPVILSYIAATKRGLKEGFVAIFAFSLTRLISYCLLGFLAGLFGKLLTERLHQFGYIVFLLGGIFISGLGLLIILGKEPNHHLCQVLKSHIVDNSIKGPIFLGFTLGILPCLPLLGVLSYIALKTQNFWQGAFYGLAFGAGKFISPLIPLGVLASVLPTGLIKNQRIYSFFTRLCGFILFLIGVNLILSRIWR